MISPGEPAHPLAESLANRYRLERELGQGGMATVYLAEDLRHHRQVALKVLKPDLAAALGADRFLREVRVTAALQHPHILPLFDSGEVNGLPWYAMPYVAGESLRDRLQRERRLPVAEAVQIARQVASALGHAHQRGVVHRDVKPENILLHEGHAYVADFGIALAVARADTGRLTETGLAVGTPQYMSPEQATNDGTIDGRSDQWALAAMLYEALAGEPPHTGATAQALVMRIVAEPPTSLHAMRPGVPPGLDTAVMRALRKVPADRYPTAEAFEAALGMVATTLTDADGHAAPPPGEVIHTPPGVSAAARHRRRAAQGILAAGAALLLAWPVINRLQERGGGPAAGAAMRIAILPCEDRMGDQELAYIAEGLPENLADRLTRVGDLHVVPRGMVRQAARATTELPEVARRLDASHLITCSASRVGDGVRIRAEFTDMQVTPPRALWAHVGVAAPDALLAIEDSLLKLVATSIPVRMTDDERRALDAGDTRSGEAQRLVMLGRHQWHRFTPGSMSMALQYFEQALALDSTYAEAWAWLAATHIGLAASVGAEPMRVPIERAREAVRRGLAVQPDYPLLLSRRANISMWYDRDLDAALRDAGRAVALNPDRSEAHQTMAHVRAALGEFDAALESSDAAIRLAPGTPRLYTDRAGYLVLARRYDEALRSADEAIALDPLSVTGHIWRGYPAALMGRAAEAIASMERAVALAPTSPNVAVDRAVVLGLLGRHAEARRVLEPLARDSTTRDPTLVAAAWGLMGERDRAFEWLARAERDGSRLLVALPYDPRFDALRDDPRFEEFLAIARRPRVQ